MELERRKNPQRKEWQWGCNNVAEERLGYSCGREANLGFWGLWLCSPRSWGSVFKEQGLVLGLFFRGSLKYAVEGGKRRPKVIVLFCIPEPASVLELFSCSENACLYLEREIGYCVLGTAALDGLDRAFKVGSPPKQRAFSRQINGQWLFSSPEVIQSSSLHGFGSWGTSACHSGIFLSLLWGFAVLRISRLKLKISSKKGFCVGNAVPERSDSTAHVSASGSSPDGLQLCETFWFFILKVQPQCFWFGSFCCRFCGSCSFTECPLEELKWRLKPPVDAELKE